MINWYEDKNYDKSLFVLLFVSLFASSSFAQIQVNRDSLLKDSTQYYLFVTNRGDSLLGRVLDYTAPELSIQLSSNDSLYYDESSIKSIFIAPPPTPLDRQEEATISEKYTNLFVSASAFSLKNGSKQVKNNQFIWNEITFGATDHYNISVGFVMPFYILLKTKIATNNSQRKFNVAAGANVLFGIPSFEDFPRAVHLYSAYTIGQPNKNLNVNIGYAVDLRGNNQSFIISGGGLFEITNHWYILLDHLLLIEDSQHSFFPGVGISYSNSNHRIDAGFFYFTNFISSVINAPGIGYSYNF